mmetsp:Transcript_54466/g.159011  ORF Transcript_54466/g.159011 Transcript_54466/m.159011 type:complete len:246 (+) Transcript_54466:415-1152(+)
MLQPVPYGLLLLHLPGVVEVGALVHPKVGDQCQRVGRIRPQGLGAQHDHDALLFREAVDPVEEHIQDVRKVRLDAILRVLVPREGEREKPSAAILSAVAVEDVEPLRGHAPQEGLQLLHRPRQGPGHPREVQRNQQRHVLQGWRRGAGGAADVDPLVEGLHEQLVPCVALVLWLLVTRGGDEGQQVLQVQRHVDAPSGDVDAAHGLGANAASEAHKVLGKSGTAIRVRLGLILLQHVCVVLCQVE